MKHLPMQGPKLLAPPNPGRRSLMGAVQPPGGNQIEVKDEGGADSAEVQTD